MRVYVQFSAWKFMAEATGYEIGQTISLELKRELNGHFDAAIRKQINTASWLVECRHQDEYWGGGEFLPVIDVKPV